MYEISGAKWMNLTQKSGALATLFIIQKYVGVLRSNLKNLFKNVKKINMIAIELNFFFIKIHDLDFKIRGA